MVSARETLKRKVVCAARAFQRRAVEKRGSVAAEARKIGVSTKVFRTALKNPKKRLELQQEKTRILRFPADNSAADIARKIKPKRTLRRVREVRHPVNQAKKQARLIAKRARFISDPATRKRVGEAAMRQHEDDLVLNSQLKSMRY